MKLQLVLAVYETLYWAHSRLKASQCVNGLPWCECALGCIRNIININTVGINNHGLSRFSPAAQSSLFFALYFSYANGIVFTRLLCPILVVDLLIYFSLWSRLVFSVKVNISYTCRITINYLPILDLNKITQECFRYLIMYVCKYFNWKQHCF